MATTIRRARESQTGRVDDGPQQDRSLVAIAGLVLSSCSVAVPIVTWFAVPDSVSGETVSRLATVALMSCFAALFGFIAGIVGRHDPRGVLAIVLSILGGLLSMALAGLMGLALALGGVNAGL